MNTTDYRGIWDELNKNGYNSEENNNYEFTEFQCRYGEEMKRLECDRDQYKREYGYKASSHIDILYEKGIGAICEEYSQGKLAELEEKHTEELRKLKIAYDEREALFNAKMAKKNKRIKVLSSWIKGVIKRKSELVRKE
jgi:hypothetical protein